MVTVNPRSALSTLSRALRRLGLVLAASVAVYALILLRPSLLFAHSLPVDNLVFHARTPFPPEAKLRAREALARLARSPYFDPSATYDVYFCDTPELYSLFALWQRRSGALSQYLITGNIFMRPSRIARDRLLDGHGREKTDRTLTYFIAHELTHTAVARRVGRLAYSRLESWQREGYADYVGKAGDFDFARTHAGFLAGARELDPRKSGLYLRYHLFAAYLLDARGWTAEELNARPIPRARLEAALRALPPLNAP